MDFLNGFFPEHNTEVDKKLFASLMNMYVTDQEKTSISPMMKEKAISTAGDFEKLAEKVYIETSILNAKALNDKLQQSTSDVINYIRNDNAIKLYNDILKTYQSQIQGKLNEIQANINKLQRTYMQAQMTVFKEKKFYPDANSTLRITYGM
jgi:hypothetical protein